jgi:hypothetical protein
MDLHERATRVWYRTAGLASRGQKDLAVEIIEAEIRSAQHEVFIEAAKLVLSAVRTRDVVSEPRRHHTTWASSFFGHSSHTSLHEFCNIGLECLSDGPEATDRRIRTPTPLLMIPA